MRVAALLGAALVGGVIAFSLRGGARAPAAAAPAPVQTATVVRTNLVSTVLTAATLGYARARPVINHLPGTYTWLPPSGSVIGPGGALYRVDDAPAVLMPGATPAWRALARGVPDGPDVAELQAGLISFGYADGLLSVPTGHYDALTADAVKRWQRALGARVTGTVALGGVVFLPGPIRVGARNVYPGSVAAPGEAPYQTTATARAVSVPLNPTLPAVHVGEPVRIVLPSGGSRWGRATAVGSSATVIPRRPLPAGTGANRAVQVALTTQDVRHVLVAPVSALLALAGGGYGLEVVEPSGANRLLGVRTGAFSGARVQVSGAGVAPGVRVVVAQ